MDPLPDQFPLSLRAWPSNNDPSTALRSQIARIHAQRGNFRNISEKLLKKEIKAAKAGDATQEDAASSDDDEEEEKPDPLKELTVAKDKIIQQVSQALYSSEYAVDFISLLLSKYSPNAAASMSANFRNPGEYNIPLGTVGADKLQGPRNPDPQKLLNKRVIKGWKILSINKTVDAISEAAKRLEQEMEAEAKYWEDVLAIKEKDWAVCYATKTSQYDRQDNKRSDGTLAVRFGFSESAPEFRDRGLAVLRRSEDGSIALGTDVVQANPKRLQVQIKKGGVESGHSVFSLFEDQDDSIQSQVLKARNSIFEQELWHELLRESRGLVAYGVVVHDSFISCPLGSSKTVLLRFTADSDESSSPFSNNEDGKTANAICIAIHLLLSFSHRQRLRQRSQPPQPLSLENNHRHLQTPPCTLLRPVIAHIYHQAAISSLKNLLAPIAEVLVSAGFSASYSISQKSSPSSGNMANKYLYLPQSVSEKIIESLVDNIQGEATLTVQDNGGNKGRFIFTIQFRTALFPITTTQYRVLGASEAFKPPPSFAAVGEVKEYILYATSCSLAELFTKPPEAQEPDTGNGEDIIMENTTNDQPSSEVPSSETGSWHTTVHSNIIRQAIPSTNEIREVSFAFDNVSKIETTPSGVYMRVDPCLRVERKYKYGDPRHDEDDQEVKNRRTGGTSMWVAGGGGGGETRSVREVIEGGNWAGDA